MKTTFLRTLCFALVLGASGAASAQDYPTRPIKLIAAAGPGGGTDYLARMVAKDLSASLRQPVVVENKPGASGNLATDLVAKAPKDGYTLLLGYGAPLATNVSLFGSALPYDPLKDLAPVTQLAETPEFLVVSPQLGVNTLDELIKLLRASPGKYSMASGGAGTVMHLSGELFKLRAKVDATHVPYKGEGPALADLLAGHVPMMMGTASSLTHVRSGKLRALAVSSSKRSPIAPEVPTFGELGYPEINLSAWFAILAPAGTPQPIIEKLRAGIAASINSKAVTADLIERGYTPMATGPEQLTERMKSEIGLMAEIVKAAKLKPLD